MFKFLNKINLLLIFYFLLLSNFSQAEIVKEIDIQGRESFLTNGGENFDLIPCLNDSQDHIDLLENLVKKYI